MYDYGTVYGVPIASILINIVIGHDRPRWTAIGWFIAGTIAVVLLSFFAVPFFAFALRVVLADFFTLMLFSLSAVALLSGKSLAHGLLSLVLGLIIATTRYQSAKCRVLPAASWSCRKGSLLWWRRSDSLPC